MKINRCLSSLVLLVCFGAAYAQADEEASTSFSLRSTTGAELGIQLSGYRYNEFVGGDFFMSTEGPKLGLTGAVTLAMDGAWQDWFFSLDGRYSEGQVNYQGSGTMSGVPDTLTDVRALLGKDMELEDNLLAPYTGIGIRLLYNDLRGTTSTGAVGYRRESTYMYLPVGLIHRVRITEGDARLSTSLEYNHLLEGKQVSRTTDYGADTDLTNYQRNGYGLRFNVAYETPGWSLGAFYNYWNIQSSDNSVYIHAPYIVTAYEPLNITRELGIQLKYRFR